MKSAKYNLDNDFSLHFESEDKYELNNTEFCLLIGINDIPWNRIVGCYSRATNFPDLISKLTSKKDTERQNALKEISINIEHQSTIYTVTPLTFIFLFRVLNFRKTIENDPNLCIQYTNDIFDLILKILNIVKFNLDNIEIKNPKIENLKGLISKEYLWEEYTNEEQEEINWEKNICSTDYYYSINLNIVDVVKSNHAIIENIGLTKWHREKWIEILFLINEMK